MQRLYNKGYNQVSTHKFKLSETPSYTHGDYFTCTDCGLIGYYKNEDPPVFLVSSENVGLELKWQTLVQNTNCRELIIQEIIE